MTANELLLGMGIPANLLGFRYLVWVIENTTEQDATMSIYNKVAENFGITPSKAERNIRHAVSYDKLLHQKYTQKLNNSAYISVCRMIIAGKIPA